MESPLLKLPIELWIKILAHLDEQDLNNLNSAVPSIFETLINDNELWKQIFIQLYKTIYFPNISKSNNYYDEFTLKLKHMKEWKHNRGIKTKYNITSHANRDGVVDQVEHLVFEYPKMATYNNGVITILNLEKNLQKKASRMTYIPCTTPQGCSTMNFNLHAANFGRYDGRVFGKNLTNKSYLSPVVEYDSIHSNSVSSITCFNDTNKDDDLFCCSGDLNGNLIWWLNSKRIHSLKISNYKITSIFLFKANITVILDSSNTLYYVIPKLSKPNGHKSNGKLSGEVEGVKTGKDTEIISMELPVAKNFEISLIKLDNGGENLIICDTNSLYIVSIRKESFGQIKKYTFKETEHIQYMSIDESTANKTQNQDLIGYDGCFISLLTEYENNSTVYVFNVRSPLDTLRPQTVLPFEEKCFITCINSVVLLVAFDSKIGVFNPLNGDELRVITKLKEKYPQFLKMSDEKIIIGSNDTFQFIQYVKNVQSFHHSISSSNSRSKKPSTKSFKALNALATQLNDYHLDRTQEEKDRAFQNMLREKYGGSVGGDRYETYAAQGRPRGDGEEDDDEEDIQLQIALMESETQNHSGHHQQQEHLDEEAEMLRLALEASMVSSDDHPWEENQLDLSTNSVEPDLFFHHPSSSSSSSASAYHSPRPNTLESELTEEEQLALALQLSLSES